jgi:tetratricopeptide (TPR) repeat protein
VIGKPPAYVPEPGAPALSRRLKALLSADVPVACPVYLGLGRPGALSARHAESTHAIAAHLADGDAEALPHFNTNPPPILRVVAAVSHGRLDAAGADPDAFPGDLGSDLWRRVRALAADPDALGPQERRRLSDLMLRLGYPRRAGELLGMSGADPRSHDFDRFLAVEQLTVLFRGRHDTRVLERRALEMARDASYPARVRYVMANFVVVRNGRRGEDSPALHEAADLAVEAVAALDAPPFAAHLATQTVYRAVAFVPFVLGDGPQTLKVLSQAEEHQLAAEPLADGPLQRLAWIDHAFPLYETVARTHLRLGDAAQAVTATETLVGLSPNDPRAWDIRGQALILADRPEEAIEAYRHALPIGGLPVAKAAFHLGWLHAQLGRRDEASHYYRMSQRIDPTVPVLDDLIEAVRG